jgi:hypothetical protein
MVVLFADRSRLLVCGTWSRRELEESENSSGPQETEESSGDGKATCPKCGRKVHPYNLNRTSDGKDTTGCTFCGGRDLP